MRPDYSPRHGRNEAVNYAKSTKDNPFNCPNCMAEVGGCPAGKNCLYGELVHISTGSHLCHINTAIESEKGKS